ncbi:MAG: HAMP domain-containing histidine kinase [Oscillospiraceae bacterium]|nr:HAMP domain-containing histidine kinase [Oscillospiraceae bacterium]
MHNSILSDYFKLCIAVIAAALLCMAAVISAYVIRTSRAQTREYIDDVAHTVILSFKDRSLKEIVSDASKWTDTTVIIFNDAGNALASTEASFSYTHLSSYSCRTADKNGYYAVDELGGVFPEAVPYIIYSVTFSDSRQGYLVVSRPDAGSRDFTIGLIITIVAVTAVFLMIAVVLLRHTIRRIVHPVQEMTIAAKRFGDGNFTEKVNVTDHSEMGFLASTLNDMAQSLSEIEDERKGFVSNVSHELKTPMTTIGGFVDGILDGTIPPDEHRYYLTIVSEEIQRLSRLVRSMLNISKYESGEIKLQRMHFDLTSLTQRTVLLFEKRIDSKYVDVLGLDDDPHFVDADMDLIQQVIYNLTENAVKFVNQDGYIKYFFTEHDGMISLAVRNSGEGLKKNEMSRVFDRFYKTDESRGRDKTGVGLGLSIVRSIVKLHDGSVLVRSREGEYTEFEITIPISGTEEQHGR